MKSGAGLPLRETLFKNYATFQLTLSEPKTFPVITNIPNSNKNRLAEAQLQY